MRETGGKNRRMRFYKENCEGSAAGMKGLGNVQRGVKSLKNPAKVSTGIMFF